MTYSRLWSTFSNLILSISWGCSTEDWNHWAGWTKAEVLGGGLGWEWGGDQADEQSKCFSQILKMQKREPAAFISLHDNSSTEIHHFLYSSLIQYIMNVWPHTTCNSGLQGRNRKSPKSKVFWQWVSHKAVFTLGHPLRNGYEHSMSQILVLSSAFPSLWSGPPHKESNLQLSSAFLGLSYLFGSQT